MIPLIPALVLAFLSFLSSAFVILRIVIPILPPHPLSRRVRPSEFGLPDFRSLSPADKSHVWLAACDVISLILFTWQVVNEYLNASKDYDAASDPASAVRLWLALTLRQTCLFIVAMLTLVHVRMGRSVALGKGHWMIWAPTALLVITGTAISAVLAATNVPSFFIGLFAYSTTISVASTVAFGCLMGTFVMIRHNLATLNDIRDPWPPAQEVEVKPRPSFATEDIDALKDGSSWITSRASSHRESVSAFSFSTHHSARPSNGSVRIMQNPAGAASHPSIPPKSSFWFNPATPFTGRDSPVPPVPPLPSPYRNAPDSLDSLVNDPDPFRRAETPHELGSQPRDRMGSQTSWLTEPSIYQPTLSAWSFPATRPSSPITSPSTPGPDVGLLPSTTARSTPIMTETPVLGGYGYDAEKMQVSMSSTSSGDVDVDVPRTVAWLASIWLPFVFSTPYLLITNFSSPIASSAVSILFVLSVTMSSPLLALHVLCKSPLPIPSGLFETYSEPPSAANRAPSPTSLAPSFKFSHEYKRSGSVTVVEGRRSGDVWVSNGDATDGKNKLQRAVGLLQPVPKLSVLPINDVPEPMLTPPLPIQNEEDAPTIPPTPQSENYAEFGQHRTRKESKASSYYSGASAEAHLQSQIFIAQKHYSTLATKMVLPPSPDRRASFDDAPVGAATGVEAEPKEASRGSQHLRTRSVSSIKDPRETHFPMSPPPSLPLPPTPPSMRELRERQAKLLTHRKTQSHSSSVINYSFRPVDDDNVAEIDALSAGLLPILVPGLMVGSDVRVREWTWDSPASIASRTSSKYTKLGKTSKGHKAVPSELGGLSSEFPSPELHSTPPARRAKTMQRDRKISAHKRNHFSLPSLGKDGLHTLSMWRNELNQAIEGAVRHYTAATGSDSRRNTVYGGEMFTNAISGLNMVDEREELLRPTSPVVVVKAEARPVSTGTFGQPPPSPEDVPANVNPARNSLATLITALDQELRLPPPSSAASDVTLFDFDTTTGPVAESTPHESKTRSRPSSYQPPPPVPQLPNGTKSSRRSSIVYIKSDENSPPAPKPAAVASKSISQWPSRAVKPLMPKSRAHKIAKEFVDGKQGSPPGLRPLSLLQDRDVNSPIKEIRALSIGKKSKHVNDENADPNPKGKGLKPLRLARKDTTKERAALRKSETLPDVVVRPPSQSQHNGFGYTFAL
ncbi:uncharacterized protein B0H18DRAFT_503 [Fomitopsis serialis]|uniref:uncharacterized protein n=1 Tax=Fomitopsis serialis TaxID=139415 RepID=UPI0020089BCE|nr:uncharacterized protein B0H18DRAFT_503 [Neoantrodia serialis]KAH9938012.1 hypothetical protein B0H18DRAFT_503 [Neoantrodia serialis]